MSSNLIALNLDKTKFFLFLVHYIFLTIMLNGRLCKRGKFKGWSFNLLPPIFYFPLEIGLITNLYRISYIINTFTQLKVTTTNKVYYKPLNYILFALILLTVIRSIHNPIFFFFIQNS